MGRNDLVTATDPAPPAQAFDIAALDRYLRRELGSFEGIVQVAKFDGGQSNPTYLLTTALRRLVLRRKPPGVLLPSAHAVEREFRVIRALAKTDVPVPEALLLCMDETVIGTPFYLMAHVAGPIYAQLVLPGLGSAERAAVYAELNRVLAALHEIDPAAVGLQDYGRPGNYMERQVARWVSQYRGSQTDVLDDVEQLIAWLPANTPPAVPARIVHGDFRLPNVIFDAVALRILAVLDWELSTLGDPLADLAYYCMSWRLPAEEGHGRGGLDLAALGLPSEADHVAGYCRRRGLPPMDERRWEFYLVFNMLRLIGILQGVKARSLAGNAASPRAAAVAARIAPLARLAMTLVERLERRSQG